MRRRGTGGLTVDDPRDWILRLAERIYLAHCVLARLTERRGWDGTEADYCVLGRPGEGG